MAADKSNAYTKFQDDAATVNTENKIQIMPIIYEETRYCVSLHKQQKGRVMRVYYRSSRLESFYLIKCAYIAASIFTGGL
jgi:hypothetical protein